MTNHKNRYKVTITKVFKILFFVVLFFLISNFKTGIRAEETFENDLRLTNEISQHGITWRFANKERTGRFVNGDYYVVGPVTIIEIFPKPEGGRNGSVLNIPPVNNRSGFDSRIKQNRYDPLLRAKLPIDLKPGDSLVSSISVDEIGTIKRVLRKGDPTISPVRSVSILTCLDKQVPQDAFRPSYCGTENRIFLARNINRKLLPILQKVPYTPDIKEYEKYFQRPWIDTLQFEFDFPVEYMPDYGRELTRVISIAWLLLSLDFTDEQKEPLLIYLVNYGIDLYGVIKAGHPGWPAHGGHGNGRKLPIIMAGILLGDAEMQAPQAKFSEDMQTMYGKGWTGATALYAGHVGKNGLPGKIGWGSYEHLEPKDWPSMIGESYRRCCTSIAWVGEALAARLLGAEKAWNHPAFFDYVERWMTEDDSKFVRIIKEQTGKDYSARWARQGQCWDKFVENMWHRYWNKP